MERAGGTQPLCGVWAPALSGHRPTNSTPCVPTGSGRERLMERWLQATPGSPTLSLHLHGHVTGVGETQEEQVA